MVASGRGWSPYFTTCAGRNASPIGHASIEKTSDVHTHSLEDTRRKAIDEPNRRFSQYVSSSVIAEARGSLCVEGADRVIWRRRTDSNRCIKVLQTSPLATWVRRPMPGCGTTIALWA
jgi:hypothetical protein